MENNWGEKKMKDEDEVKKNIGYGVAKTYWKEKKGFSHEDYKQVIRNCTADNFGFCESCMGNIECETAVKGEYNFTR